MAGWNHETATWEPKVCVVCKTTFTPKSGPHKFCTATCKGKWKYQCNHVTTETQYKRISGNWTRYLSRLMYYGGRKRDLLSREIILGQLEKQDYKCALSGVQLTCILEKGVITQTNASIDRINAGGAYTSDNIQIVCVALNHWRADTSVEDFVEWCRKVVNFYDSNIQKDEVL